VSASKPEPDVFLKAIEAADLDPRRTVAVGDSVWDVKAARAANIGCVGVESGGFSRHELAEAGALQVYGDVAELLALIHTSPLAGVARAG
jgi:phosphoglycolate phosphatase-like HAD superfamily hydrolase